MQTLQLSVRMFYPSSWVSLPLLVIIDCTSKLTNISRSTIIGSLFTDASFKKDNGTGQRSFILVDTSG